MSGDGKVSVYAITRGTPRIEFVGCMSVLAGDPRVVHFGLHPTLYLHHGRSECVMDFLGTSERGDWLMFIDDDMCWTAAAFDAVMAADGLIKGGVYWSPTLATTDPTNDVFPIVFERQAGQVDDPTFRDTFVYKPMPRGWVASQSFPFKCDAVGTGFLMVHRSVLEAMTIAYPPPLSWFDMQTIDGVGCGEDLVFCDRARRGLGYSVYAVPMPNPHDLLHIKTVRIGRPPLGN